MEIVEAAVKPGTVRLYRGDSSNIEQFDAQKTNLFSLFGHGIYLTDNKRVANDYRSKGSEDGQVIWRFSGYKTKQAVLDRLLDKLAAKIDENGKDRSGEMAFWSKNVPYSDGGDWQVATNDLRRQERAARYDYARKLWKNKMSKMYEIRMKLDGTAVVQKKHVGQLAEFDVPEAMINKCLVAEEAIADDILSDIISIHKRHGDDATARDIEAFARQQRWDGEEVSFRTVFTSLTADSPLRGDWEVQQKFCDDLREMGYTGISYAGGLSMGGGYKHRAYVFWDAEAINACRVA